MPNAPEILPGGLDDGGGECHDRFSPILGESCLRRIIACLAIGLAGRLAAADSVTWLTSDLPPQYIASGELAGQGIKDQQLKLVEATLAEFDHHTMRASISRLWYQIQHEDGYCGLGVLRSPEREKIAVFSRRPVLVPGFRLIVRDGASAAFAPYMTPSGEIDLAALMRSRRLNGGYVTDRVYPETISRYIDAGDRRAPLEKSVDSERLFQLLRSNRVDFVFGLAYEASYYAWKINVGAPLAALPIKDTPSVVAGYAACSNTPLGQAVIARLDTIQSDEGVWRQWVAPLKRWLDPADYAIALAGQN